MIEQLQVKDIFDAAQLIRLYACELGFSQEFSLKHTCRKLEDMDLSYVYKHDNNIVGIIGGSIGSSPWTPDVNIMHEEIYYVHKDNRKSKIGFKLLEQFVESTEKLDLDMMTMKAMTSSPALDRSYARYGLTKLETTYLRRF